MSRKMSLARLDSTLNDNLGDILICAICLDQLWEPRILNCGHHFCNGCLTSLSNKADIRRCITCPTCRRATFSTVSDLPRSIIVEQIQLARVGGSSKVSDAPRARKPCLLLARKLPASIVYSVTTCYVSRAVGNTALADCFLATKH